MEDGVPVTFVTAEPYLGHLGFGQTATRERLEQLFTRRQIGYRTGVGVARVERDAVTLCGGEHLPARAAVIMPPFTGAINIWKSAGLTDGRGMIP